MSLQSLIQKQSTPQNSSDSADSSSLSRPSVQVDCNISTEHRVCLFSVHSNSREMRRKRIEAVAKQEPCLGFLAAVFDFEWMARRAILALSETPTATIKIWFSGKHGIDAYKDGWKEFVVKQKKMLSLPFLLRHEVPGKTIDWSLLKDAFEQRHPLVHGFKGFIEDDVAFFNTRLFLNASDVIEEILRKTGASAFATIKNRRAKTDADESAREAVANNRAKMDELNARVTKRVAKSKQKRAK